MKKFYSVKEAANILGFSTNTIYTHLEEGSLKGKRVGGRGRFKIPYSELAPYLGTPNEEKQTVFSSPEAVMPQRVGIGWTVLGIAFGVAVGYYAFNFSMPKLVTDIALAAFDYSGRTSFTAGNIVETQVPRIEDGVKVLALSFTSRFHPGNTNIAQTVPEATPAPLNQITVKVPGKIAVNIREEATTSAKIIAKLPSTAVASKIGEANGWTKIAVADYPAGWVSNQFIAASVNPEVAVLGAADVQGKKATINGSLTASLKVRDAPGGNVIGKVNPGETYTVLDKSGDWYLIEIPEATNGWISAQYATLQ